MALGALLLSLVAGMGISYRLTPHVEPPDMPGSCPAVVKRLITYLVVTFMSGMALMAHVVMCNIIDMPPCNGNRSVAVMDRPVYP